MARTHVGEFSLTPSPQSNELYSDCTRNTEFSWVLLGSSSRARFARGLFLYNNAYVPLLFHFFLMRRVFAISFEIGMSRTGLEFDCSWNVTGRSPEIFYKSYNKFSLLYRYCFRSLILLFSYSCFLILKALFLIIA